MADFMNQILSKPIQLANRVIKLAKEVNFFKEECDQITYQTKELEAIFNLMVAQGRSVSYHRPLQRTVTETEQVLDVVISLLLKCRGDGIMKRVFTVIPTAAFQKTLSQLESSVDDFTQILRLLEFLDNHSYDHPRFFSIPHISYQDPDILALWELIETGDHHLHLNLIDGYLDVVAASLQATSTNLQFHNILWTAWPLIGNLYHTSQDRRSFGVKLLLLVSQLSDQHKKVIIEEGAISPLLKLMEEGRIEDQETIAKVIGTIGYNSESVNRMIDAGVFLKFAEVLKESPMKVQAEVAWAISQIAANCLL